MYSSLAIENMEASEKASSLESESIALRFPMLRLKRRLNGETEEEGVESRGGNAFMPRRENQGRAFARALPEEASTCLTLRPYNSINSLARTPTVPLSLLSLPDVFVFTCDVQSTRPPGYFARLLQVERSSLTDNGSRLFLQARNGFFPYTNTNL